jgi:hypothetical protein
LWIQENKEWINMHYVFHFLPSLKLLLYLHLWSCTVRSEIRCALRLRYVDLVASIEVAVEVYCCFSAFSC